MKYFENSKINRGKKFLNISVIIFLILNIIAFVSHIFEKENISINGDIIHFVIILSVSALYYRGNKIAFKLVALVTPCFFVIPALPIFGPTTYFLELFGILDLWGGSLFLIIGIIQIGFMYLLFRKIGWFECIEEYRLYRNDKTN